MPIAFKLSGKSKNKQSSTNDNKPRIIKKHFVVQNVHLGSNGTLTGAVYTKKGHQPLVGVNIVLLKPHSNKFSTTGAATNGKGEFVIKNIKANQGRLHLSYTGYQTEVVKF